MYYVFALNSDNVLNLGDDQWWRFSFNICLRGYYSQCAEQMMTEVFNSLASKLSHGCSFTWLEVRGLFSCINM